jgi:small conductance mechanosensitive channel
MPGLVPGIHAEQGLQFWESHAAARRGWPGQAPAMTAVDCIVEKPARFCQNPNRSFAPARLERVSCINDTDTGLSGVSLHMFPSRLEAVTTMAWNWVALSVPRLTMAVIILVVGTLLAGWAGRLFERALARTARIDETSRPVLTATVRYAILIVTILAALSQIGIQTASLLAVLGAAGLAIGLALQGTLANIAAGIMLLWLRPFEVGDYIEIVSGNPIAGRVREIGLFASRLETYDGIFVFAPNSGIWNSALRNHSRNNGRLAVFTIKLAAGADANRARGIISSMFSEDRRILPMPKPEVFVESYAESGILLTASFWATHGEIGEIQRSTAVAIKARFEAEPDIKIVQVTRVQPPDSDPSRLLSAG